MRWDGYEVVVESREREEYELVQQLNDEAKRDKTCLLSTKTNGDEELGDGCPLYKQVPYPERFGGSVASENWNCIGLPPLHPLSAMRPTFVA